MIRKINPAPKLGARVKTLSPYLLILVLVCLMIGFNYWSSSVKADNVSTSVDVGNSAPTIGEVSLNGKGVINLLEDSTVDIMASASITDNNGCLDVRDGGGVKAYVYQYPTYNASTSHDDNYMYDADIVSCSWQSTAGNTCNYECTASATANTGMYYYANPTSAAASANADQWVVTVVASDSYYAVATSHSFNDNDEAVIEVNLLLGLSAPDASASIPYGTLSADGESATIERGVRNSGNRSMNPLVAAAQDNALCVGYSGCAGGIITAMHQQYNLSTFSVDSGVSLSASSVTLDTVTLQRTSDVAGDASDDQIFWALYVPTAQTPGSYTGINSLTADPD